MGANRAVGAAGGYLADRTPGIAGTTGFALGATDAARELGGLAPALVGRDFTHPATAAAVRANATTSAIHNFAAKDALRKLGTNYCGPGQARSAERRVGKGRVSKYRSTWSQYH